MYSRIQLNILLMKKLQNSLLMYLSIFGWDDFKYLMATYQNILLFVIQQKSLKWLVKIKVLGAVGPEKV